MKYLNHKQYYRLLLKERIKAILTMVVIMGIVIISPIWLLSILITSDGMTDRINDCLKTHSFNYCNANIK